MSPSGEGQFSVLIEQLLFQIFLFFFFPNEGKTGKTGKKKDIQSLDIWKNIWNASHSNIWGKNENIRQYKIVCERKSLELDKTSFDKTGP